MAPSPSRAEEKTSACRHHAPAKETGQQEQGARQQHQVEERPLRQSTPQCEFAGDEEDHAAEGERPADYLPAPGGRHADAGRPEAHHLERSDSVDVERMEPASDGEADDHHEDQAQVKGR
jgi:hypothetical protein